MEEIEHPVEDEKGYLYERDVIEQFIRANTGAGAGTTCGARSPGRRTSSKSRSPP